MDYKSVQRAYRLYAPIYDIAFGRIVNEGRRTAINCLDQRPGDRILEIGVGTGLSLPFYNPEVQLYGIDVSAVMLEKARQRFMGPKYPHVRELQEMDASMLDYPDNSFDATVAMYVLSVVPDPEAVMLEMFRVTKPGGPVLVLNHFASRHRLLQTVEKGLAPFSRQLGFRPDFCMDNLVKIAGQQPRSVTPVNFGGYWKLLEFASLGVTG